MVEPPTTIGNSILANFFRQNEWANLKLIDACATLDPALLDTVEQGAERSLRTTLWRIIEAERRMAAVLNGDEATILAPLARTPDGALTTLRVFAIETGEALAAWAEGVAGDPMLSGEWDGEPYRAPASILAGQALLLSMEQRTRVQDALRRAGIDPPDLTAWAWWEAISEGGAESPTI